MQFNEDTSTAQSKQKCDQKKSYTWHLHVMAEKTG
jgi:hypothetical protein